MIFGFVLVLLIAGAALIVGAAYLMARALLCPPRMTDGKAAWVLKRLSPGDLGLAFQQVSFEIRDEQTGGPFHVAGWWMPHPNAGGRCVVLIHGYADAKVGAIAWAPLFHRLGFNILAVDLRAHGESDGTFTTGGYYEQRDLSQVIDQIRAQRPTETRTVVLFGISLGGSVAAATAVAREDIAGVVLDSPSTGEDHVAMIHFDLMGMPGPWIQRLALRMVRWLSGADLAAVRPLELIKQIRCPLMVIQPTDDVYVPPEDGAAIEAAAQSRPADHPTVYWHVEGAKHVMGLTSAPEEYRRRIADFLDQFVVQTTHEN
ncbi:MAG TPA: alpha/beta fold hydrolase [Tepidisphaeraceae bacterium]|nr:alpha/beta fold hydrolase [Tepidisphaeraceae bacterium]